MGKKYSLLSVSVCLCLLSLKIEVYNSILLYLLGRQRLLFLSCIIDRRLEKCRREYWVMEKRRNVFEESIYEG